MSKELLRFTTAGSVDDGKSTLIGRLLYDSKSIYLDQLESVQKSSREKGFDYLDLSLITDGLDSEREQGITIDVAYRYFESPKRKFIIADTPGHVQYTRNMVTGASTANLAIVLIDARKGLVEQTHRHSFIASLLKIPHLIVCINKMDLVNYDENTYQKIVEKFKIFSEKLDIKDVSFIPISALYGDNVVEPSNKMDWYKGPTLLYSLENVHISSDLNYIDCRFPIQLVIRPHTLNNQDFRGYSGRIESGIFKTGDKIEILPSGIKTKIKSINIDGKKIEECFAPMSVVMTFEDDIDCSRGNMVIKENNRPEISNNINVIVNWMNSKSLTTPKKIIVKHNTNEVLAIIENILYEIDINTLHRKNSSTELKLNSIGRVSLKLARPIYYDSYSKNRKTGSVIFIDPISNETIGAGMII